MRQTKETTERICTYLLSLPIMQWKRENTQQYTANGEDHGINSLQFETNQDRIQFILAQYGYQGIGEVTENGKDLLYVLQVRSIEIPTLVLYSALGSPIKNTLEDLETKFHTQYQDTKENERKKIALTIKKHETLSKILPVSLEKLIRSAE